MFGAPHPSHHRANFCHQLATSTPNCGNYIVDSHMKTNNFKCFKFALASIIAVWILFGLGAGTANAAANQARSQLPFAAAFHNADLNQRGTRYDNRGERQQRIHKRTIVAILGLITWFAGLLIIASTRYRSIGLCVGFIGVGLLAVGLFGILATGQRHNKEQKRNDTHSQNSVYETLFHSDTVSKNTVIDSLNGNTLRYGSESRAICTVGGLLYQENREPQLLARLSAHSLSFCLGLVFL